MHLRGRHDHCQRFTFELRTARLHMEPQHTAYTPVITSTDPAMHTDSSTLLPTHTPPLSLPAETNSSYLIHDPASTCGGRCRSLDSGFAVRFEGYRWFDASQFKHTAGPQRLLMAHRGRQSIETYTIKTLQAKRARHH